MATTANTYRHLAEEAGLPVFFVVRLFRPTKTYDLRAMPLGDWHPREIPETLLRNPAMQEQQGHTLPPWEQWYVMLLHNGKLPGASEKRPNTAFTSSLLSNARDRVPRLRWEGEVALRDFLVDKKRLGIACDKHRTSHANGWSFPPLAECRASVAANLRFGEVGQPCE
jgi:hypothetical protein